MNITFNEQMGQNMDIFTSLCFMAGKETTSEMFNKLQIKQNENVDKAIEELKKVFSEHLKKVDFFFSDETKIISALIDVKGMWNNSLAEVLNVIKNKGEDEIKYNLVRELTYGVKISEEEVKKIIITRDSFVEFIKGLDISAEGKWNLFLFIQDTKAHLEEIVALINDYVPKYNKVIKKYSKYIEKEALHYKNNITENGISYIKKLIKTEFDLENGVDEISISFMFFNCYSIISHSIEKTRFMLLGIRYEELINKICGDTDIENNLLILKNLSDKTRFNIIKMLSNKQCYGLELAEQFNLTNATISYHMSYLQFAKLVHIEKKDHKAYYSLNKKEVKKSFEFFYKELGLDE